LLSLSTLVLAGCDAPGFTTKSAKSPSQQAQTPVGTTTTTSAVIGNRGANAKQNPAVYTPALSVSDLVAEACGIKRERQENAAAVGAAATTSFDYDSAALGESDRQLLSEVAKCLTEGALKGRSVTLIGRADARGEPEYNMTLGESRASTVHRYLVDLGVGKGRMRPTSRGEIDATGTSEEGWAHDRRVDIELVL
jgi:peptidoglycan-associated lipoprotein